MELKELQVKGFGKFHNKAISLNPSINIIHGPNEAGKSALHGFIGSMFFGIDKGKGRLNKNDPYQKYLPWEHEEDFGGSLTFSGTSDDIWRIERNLHKSNQSFQITNQTTGLTSEQPAQDLDVLLGNLKEPLYINTLSIGQLKSSTNKDMVSELKNYIVNLHTAGDLSIDISKAASYLRQERRDWLLKLHSGADQKSQEATEAIGLLEDEITRLPSIKHGGLLKKERSALKNQIEDINKKQEQIQPKMDKVKEILHSYDFQEEEDIFFLQNQTEKDFSLCKSLEKKSSLKEEKLFLITLFAISVLAVIFAAFFYFQQIFFPSGCLASLSILAYIGGHLISAKRRRAAKKLAEVKKQLSIIFERFLHSDDISDESYENFKKRIAEIKALFTKLKVSEESSKKLLKELVSLQDRMQKISEALEALQKIEWELEKKQEMIADLIYQKELAEAKIAENHKIQEEIASIDLALGTIEKLSTTIHDSFGIYLNKSASEYIEILTQGAYNNMSVDENLNLFLNTKDKLIPLEQISRGTIEQVYLALRLAIIDFIWPKEAMPLFLDDSFALYDDGRLKAALSFLSRNYRGQVILFTCHKRERKFIEEMKVPYNYIEIR